MKKTREQIRAELQAGMAIFLSEGKMITKIDAKKPKVKRQPKEQIVEIEVDFLPTTLRQKYFSES
jgi:hypothetical protein